MGRRLLMTRCNRKSISQKKERQNKLKRNKLCTNVLMAHNVLKDRNPIKIYKFYKQKFKLKITKY